MFKQFASKTATALMAFWLSCSSAVMASSQPNVVTIKNGLTMAQYTPQVMLLMNYGSNTINLQDITAQPPSQIQFYSTSNTPTAGALPGVISYFYLPTNHSAVCNYSAAHPFHAAIWVPVDTSSNGQNPTTSWFNNTCFGYPQTSGAPSYALPAGATLVEPFLTGNLSDTIDISEVNGVTAQWQVSTPNRGWCSGSFRDGSQSPNYPQIQWPHITNQPGAGPKFFGDYGNPGVFPFGCTNCVSRYSMNGPLYAGCNNPGYKFFDYPSGDKGCDNAINPFKSGFTSPPPGVSALPVDAFWPTAPVHNPPTRKLYVPTSGGFSICQLGPSAGNPVVAPGGPVTITLLQYPFGQVQAQDTSF